MADGCRNEAYIDGSTNDLNESATFNSVKSVNGRYGINTDESSLVIPDVKIYRRRWYLLAVFSAFSMIQCAVWNTWGPVAHPAMVVFHWQQQDIAMLANYGCIMIVVCMTFFMWLLVEKGKFDCLAPEGPKLSQL